MTISQKELAAALGIDPSVVARQKARGMPVHSVAAAAAWRDAHVRPRVPEAGAAPTPRYAAPAGHREAAPHQTQRADPLPPDYLVSRARKEAAEAELAELRLAEERDAVIRVDAIKAQLAREFTSIRDALLQLPHRLAPILAAETDSGEVSRKMEEAICECLQQLAEWRASRPTPEDPQTQPNQTPNP
jgi:hypothetical protein